MRIVKSQRLNMTGDIISWVCTFLTKANRLRIFDGIDRTSFTNDFLFNPELLQILWVLLVYLILG